MILDTKTENGKVRISYSPDTVEHAAIMESVREKFSWVNPKGYFTAGEVDRVVTAGLHESIALPIFGYTHLYRKFELDSGLSYLKYYTKPEAPFHLLPAGVSLLSVGRVKAEEYRPSPPLRNECAYYFTGDCDVIEAFYELPKIRGAYSTFYGATYLDDTLIKVKQYTYDTPGRFADWTKGGPLDCPAVTRVGQPSSV